MAHSKLDETTDGVLDIVVLDVTTTVNDGGVIENDSGQVVTDYGSGEHSFDSTCCQITVSQLTTFSGLHRS